jgi:hypothetical protein
VGSGWWLPKINPDLSQGDIIRDLPVWIAAPALVFLENRTLPGDRKVWVESSAPKPDNNGFSHLLIKARHFVGVVLTHDCQLDKQAKKVRVQLAAATDIERVNSEERTKIMNQRSLSQLVLPDIPELGTYYADMRIVFTVDKSIITEPMRAVSMTEAAKNRLQNQIIAYFSDRQRPVPK